MASTRPRQANTVLDRMRSDGWGAVAETPPYSLDDDKDSSSESEKGTEAHQSHEGWKIWQKVVEATTGRVEGVRSAVQNRMNVDDKLYESDEEGYTGGDSHLIRVMKEYHISQSSSPDDLPTWLFPERPRRGERVWASSSSSERPNDRSYSSDRSLDDSYGDVSRVEASRHPGPPMRRSSEASAGEPAVTVSRERRFQPEHGNRTAQKLRQMKTERKGSKSSL